MFYSFGPQYCFNLLYTVAKPFFTRAVSELEVDDFQRAYQSWVASIQPALPAPHTLDAEVVVDALREEQLLRPLLEPSQLDDLAHYKATVPFQTVQQDRAQHALEAAHVRAALDAFRPRDPSYWEAFDIFTNYIVCAASKHTPGGTSSGVLGTIFLVRPSTRNADTLYELLVHECTHLMMFVDERRSRHYRSLHAIAQPENFAVSAVYEQRRPLDKTLHSVVVSTEVLLHREHVIGHDNESTVHPPTAKLVASTLRSCDALLDLQANKQLLAPRGVQLVETCARHLEPLVRAAA